MKFEITNLNLFCLIATLFFGNANLNAQVNPSLFNQYRYMYSDSPRLVYAGKVIGMNSAQFDSLYAETNWKYLQPITKSTHPIEIRFKTAKVYSSPNPVCTILYYDSSFNLERFSQNGKALSLNAKAEVIYNKLIENAIFNLEQFHYSKFTSDSVTLYSSSGWRKYPFTEIHVDHEHFYSLEYKVGDLYNKIFIDLKYYMDFPDNQLLRRYTEIKRALMVGL